MRLLLAPGSVCGGGRVGGGATVFPCAWKEMKTEKGEPYKFLPQTVVKKCPLKNKSLEGKSGVIERKNEYKEWYRRYILMAKIEKVEQEWTLQLEMSITLCCNGTVRFGDKG